MGKTAARFDPDALGDQDRARQDRRITLVMGLCVALGVGVLFLLPSSQPGARDAAGAPVQSGAGRITRVRYTRHDSEIGPSPFYVNVLEIDRKWLQIGPGMFTQELKNGERVRFSYVVGKSGQWYLRSIQPDEAAKH